MIQGRLPRRPFLTEIPSYVNRVLTALAVVSTLTVIIGTGVFVNVYNNVDVKQDELPDIFNGTVEFPSIIGFTLSPKGIVQGVTEGIVEGPNGTLLDPVLTYDISNYPNGAVFTAVGPSFQLNVTGGVALAGLKSRGVAGTFTNPIITTVDDGIIANITNGGPIQAGDVIYGMNTVGNVLGDILGAELLAYGSSVLPNSKPLVAVGPSFYVNTSGPVVQAGLLPRGTGGTFLRPLLTSTSDGIIETIANGPPILSSEVLFSNTTVQAALLSNIMTTGPSPALPNSRPFSPNVNAFIYTVTGSEAVLTLRPRPMIGTTCNYPVQISYDSEFGLPQACTAGPIPGTPGGSATLDGSGKLDPDQIPDFLLSLRLIGFWNADLNSPPLFNSSCPVNESFYYLVSDSGNTTLGHHPFWLEGDTAVCLNGTWGRISRPLVQPTSFNGRSGTVLPQLGDYDSSLITFGNFTLDVLAGYGFVMWTSSPGLSNGQLLVGQPGEIEVSGTSVGLAPKPNFPSPLTVFNGFINYLEIDHFGRVETVATGNPLLNIFGTLNQVSVSGTQNVTISLEQDIHTGASPTFAAVQVSTIVLNGKTVQSVGAGTATIPNVGTADFVMTEGAQTINGTKQVTSAIVARGAVGMTFNNAGNTFATQLLPAAALAANTVFRLPPTNGAAGSVLETDGAGATSWTASIIKTITGTPNRVIVGGTAQNPVLTTSQDLHTGASPTFASMQVSTIVINGKTVQSSGTGTVTIPNVGTSDFVMTNGAQTINNTKTFASAPIVLGGEGVRLNNAANSFSTLVSPATGLAANTNFRMPPTDGTAGQILSATGSGSTAWITPTTVVKDLQGAVLTSTTAVTSTTFATMKGMTLTSTNAATANYKVWFTAKGSTSTSNVPIEVRLLLNGTPVTNQLARYAQFENEDSTMMLLGVVPSVAAGSTILVQVRVVTATTLTINYRSLMIEEA